MGPLPDLLLATTGMEEEGEEDEVGKGISLGIKKNGKANHHFLAFVRFKKSIRVDNSNSDFRFPLSFAS